MEQPWNRDELAISTSKSQVEILRWISKLHNGGQPFECDLTYSKGVFYKDFPQPRLKFDIEPQTPDTQQADARHVPLPDGSVNSIVFDPPFVAKNVQRDNAVMGIIESRFSGFSSMRELWNFYGDVLAETYRLLASGGLLVFKCQDGVSGGVNHFSHVEVHNRAIGVGFLPRDLFILLSTSVLWSPNVTPKTQQHARKSHSYLWVFRKV